jgi:ribosome-binding protein aMBF1 (putative translation factor)
MSGESRWSVIRERALTDPEVRHRYARTKHATVLTREVLMRIDTERERAGISKAELARRIGTSPSVVRRLFTSQASNPTLRTVIDMLDVLGVDLELRSTGTDDAPAETSKLARTSHVDRVPV